MPTVRCAAASWVEGRAAASHHSDAGIAAYTSGLSERFYVALYGGSGGGCPAASLPYKQAAAGRNKYCDAKSSVCRSAEVSVCCFQGDGRHQVRPVSHGALMTAPLR